MLRVGDELKAAADDSDFSLYVDSAYVNRGDDNTEYGYYIYKGAEVRTTQSLVTFWLLRVTSLQTMLQATAQSSVV